MKIIERLSDRQLESSSKRHRKNNHKPYYGPYKETEYEGIDLGKVPLKFAPPIRVDIW